MKGLSRGQLRRLCGARAVVVFSRSPRGSRLDSILLKEGWDGKGYLLLVAPPRLPLLPAIFRSLTEWSPVRVCGCACRLSVRCFCRSCSRSLSLPPSRHSSDQFAISSARRRIRGSCCTAPPARAVHRLRTCRWPPHPPSATDSELPQTQIPFLMNFPKSSKRRTRLLLPPQPLCLTRPPVRPLCSFPFLLPCGARFSGLKPAEASSTLKRAVP